MAKSRIKKILFLLINVFLYLYFGKNYFLLPVLTIFNFYFGNIVYKKKNSLLLIIGIIVNLLPLLFYKYITVITDTSFLIPLGISYFTLNYISYLSDMYHHKYQCCKKIVDFTLYSFYFPSIIIGPINRYGEFQEQINDIRFNKNNLDLCLLRIGIGLIKKIVIANKLSIIIATLNSDLSYTGLYVLFGLFIYSLLLYCDFSGGIDIILGVSKIFNIELMENFNLPFHSESVKEFWQRWHISLGNWLKNYIYIPLGGSREGKIKTKINILITFIISGLWHGINYLLWGVINGILVCCNFKTKNRYINIMLTFIFISILWIFFIYPNTLTAIKMFLSVFTDFNLSFFSDIFKLGLNIYDYVIIIICTAIVYFYDNKKDIISKKFMNVSIYQKLIILLLIIFIVLLFGTYGMDVNSNNFIYGNF